jgi:hypothetical protein
VALRPTGRATGHELLSEGGDEVSAAAVHTLTGSAGSTLARTLPSLSVLRSSWCPLLLLQRAREVTIDCRWPSSKLASTAAAPSVSALPSAAAAAGGASATTSAAGSAVATRTSPNLSEKKTCLLSAEKVHAVAFLPLFLQGIDKATCSAAVD